MLTPVGNLATPQSFAAQSAVGSVILSWQTVIGATAYYILRSTDNITFASIGNTASLSYIDSTGTQGTRYYYQLQAYNGAIYSLPTSTLTGMKLSPVGPILTPAGFALVSAQGQVALSWNLAPLATIYYVNRSLDNVTFLNVGQTASLNYVDTTGTVGTTYYYQIQAATVTYASNPTISLAGIPLKPGQTTLGNLRLECQQRCNFENKPFVTTQEWNSMISQSRKELYDIILQKFGNDYYLAAPYTYTTSQNLQFYPLPDDFYKLLGVEVALNPGDPSSWVTIKKFEFIQRNLWNYPNVYTFYGITNLRYRLEDNNLYIVPVPTGGETIRIWYAPRPNQLLNDTDIVDGVSGWEEYIVADCCIKALAKEESDPSVFIDQKQALLTRIEEVAENRDIGEPETVSDSKMRNFAWSDDNGWGGSGAGGGS